MRKRGLTVEVASINSCDRRLEELPPDEAAEFVSTFYVKGSGVFRVALQVLKITVLHPVATLRGICAASQLGEWDLKSRAYAFFYLAEALLVGKWMRSRSLNHLHVHFGGPVATVGMLTARAWRIPWSITLHGPDEFFDQEAFYLREKISSASFVVCISDFCRSQVLRIAPGLDDTQLEVVRLGVDCLALQPRRNEIAQAQAAPMHAPVRFVCTGRMVAAKGHRILLRSLALLRSAGVDFTCVLIGDGPERSSLERLCKHLGIVEQVSFLGALAHRPTLSEVAQADVFVLASFAEGLPVSLMEAMALGVPCVSTMIAAIPELIDDRENGLLIPAANYEALFDALRTLAINPELRANLASKARATVEDQYNLESNLDKLSVMWNRRLPNYGSRCSGNA